MYSTNSFSQEQLEMEALLNTEDGFRKYASEKMPDFIQVIRDYKGIVRELLPTPPVTKEELVRVNEEVFITYNHDLDSVAFVSAKYGEAPTQYVKGKTMKIPFTQLITPRLTITQFELDTQPYDLMRRAQERAGQSMARLEDDMFLNILDRIMDAFPDQTVISINDSVEKADLLALKKKFSLHDVPFGGYLMNPAIYDDFLLWGEKDLDPVTQRTVLETGNMPTIWGGVRMVTGIRVPIFYIYGLAPQELLGRMPILRDITIQIDNIPKTQDKEIMAYQYVGMFIHSHLAVTRLVFPEQYKAIMKKDYDPTGKNATVPLPNDAEANLDPNVAIKP